jgi:hypothetical protein
MSLTNSNHDISLHYHSLYGGMFVFAAIFFLAPSWTLGWIGVVVCVALDLGKIIDKFIAKRSYGTYATITIIQALVLLLVFSVARHFVFGR